MLSWIVAAGSLAVFVILLRRPVAIWRKAVFGLPVLGICAVATFMGFGMRLEREGGGAPRFVTFDSAEKQAERIEADRAAPPAVSEAQAPKVVEAAATPADI